MNKQIQANNDNANDTKAKRYRPNVSAVILSSAYPHECKFLLGHRSDISGAWQFPQGGIDEGESPKEALYRELREEIGTDDIEILSECPEWIAYDFPKTMHKKLYKDFDGQIQKYFLVRLKQDSAVNIHTKEPEFDKYQFVSPKELFSQVTHFKKDVYRKVIDYFKKEGFI